MSRWIFSVMSFLWGKLFAVVALIAALVILLGLLSGRSLRGAGLIEGRWMLKLALRDYREIGYLTNYSTSYSISPLTNSVRVSGTDFHCFAKLSGGKFHTDGVLAMTTNGVFIWIDAERPAKVIEPGYVPPIFPPRF